MSSPSSQREHLVMALADRLRDMSTWTILMHQAIANHLGLNATDHKCLDIVLRMGPMTAGELAEITGLTTGAVTGIIDRLEQAGFAKRGKDPHDRRRVIIEPCLDAAEAALGPLFAGIAQGTATLVTHYSDQDLRVILRFLEEVVDFSQTTTARLRQQAPE